MDSNVGNFGSFECISASDPLAAGDKPSPSLRFRKVTGSLAAQIASMARTHRYHSLVAGFLMNRFTYLYALQEHPQSSRKRRNIHMRWHMIQTLYIIPSLIISSSFSPMSSQMRVASAVPYNDSVDKPSFTNSRRSVKNIVSSSCIRVAKILDTRDRKSWNLQGEMRLTSAA